MFLKVDAQYSKVCQNASWPLMFESAKSMNPYSGTLKQLLVRSSTWVSLHFTAPATERRKSGKRDSQINFRQPIFVELFQTCVQWHFCWGTHLGGCGLVEQVVPCSFALFHTMSSHDHEIQVGGGKDGGIMVREGCSLKSPEPLGFGIAYIYCILMIIDYNNQHMADYWLLMIDDYYTSTFPFRQTSCRMPFLIDIPRLRQRLATGSLVRELAEKGERLCHTAVFVQKMYENVT